MLLQQFTGHNKTKLTEIRARRTAKWSETGVKLQDSENDAVVSIYNMIHSEIYLFFLFLYVMFLFFCK